MMRSINMTHLYLPDPKNLKNFLRKFRQLLKDNYQTINDSGEKRYTCGQQHSRQNPDWKPFHHLERYCRGQDLNDFEVRNFLEEHLGRPIICECDILIDRREQRKRDLMSMFGCDFQGYEWVD